MQKKSLSNLRIFPSKYSQPLFTERDAYEIDMWGGRGRGGSHNVTLHALFAMMTFPYFRGYLVRAIHGHIRDSLWQDFKDRIEELSDLNDYDLKQDFIIREDLMSAMCLPTGNILKSRGFKASTKGNTAHMKSLAGATHIYIEECEEVGQEEYYKLADSIRTVKSQRGVQLIRNWNTPSKDHWLIEEYYDLQESGVDGFFIAVPKGIPRHLSVFGTYKDNIKNLDPNTLARYERYKETNPKYYYNQILGLVSDGGDHKVYYGWKKVSYQEYLQIDGFEAFGLDFGDTAPLALIAVKYKDGCFYRHELLYESMRAMQVRHREAMDNIRAVDPLEDNQNNIWTKHKGLLTYVFNLMGVDKQTIMFCDPAQSTLIMELREEGFNAVSANKNKSGNINFINRASNFYTDNSLNMEHEYNHYYLEQDINKNPIDGKPIKVNDHCMDAQEYACIGIKDYLGLTL